jgi:hypothetical protein
MRHTLISGLLGLTLLAPAAASAATVEDIQLQLMQVLGRLAAQKAQMSGDALACALVATKSSVAINEGFALIWNTVGANEPSSGDSASQWARAGITSLAPNKPGLYKYELVFYGSGGAKTTCRTFVSVRAAH